jgi:hypothetical protein
LPNRSKQKGSRVERAIVAALQAHGFAAERLDFSCIIEYIDSSFICFFAVQFLLT